MALKITKENFEREVLNSDVPVLVDFWATWCGPCKMIAPTIEMLAQEYEGKVKVGKIDVDEEQEIAMKYGVASIPTLVLFENGAEVNRKVGFMPKSEIEEMF
ncbi:MAG: thioredoxin [Clostridia bacterium]|nr:thioredoxin [Clostridia bacterium]